ncbi:MAG: AzlC family ABC transporter permease [Oscillospiraceae bacterium]
MSYEKSIEFKKGFVLGIPIMLGYIPVAFTFGSVAVNDGLPPLCTILMSLTNLTSSGQFAATNIITSNGPIAEIIIVTIIINIRYLLMSMSLSQKLEKDMPLYKKSIFAFGVTDEVFAIAASQKEKLTFEFMLGLIITPIFGWTFGTALGTVAMNFIPEMLKNAMGIALYGMFISIIIPPAKEIKSIFKVIVFSALLSVVIFYVPSLDFISSGMSVIIVAVFGALFGAILFPIDYVISEEEQQK